MFRNWRTWVLLGLLIGPLLFYVGLGALWLAEHRGPIGFRGELLTYATMAWVLCGVLASVLGSLWTRRKQSVLPPLDWSAPGTFTRRDRTAWDMVQEQAAQADDRPVEDLTRLDTYLEAGRSLAWRLGAHYRPASGDPFEDLPVLEMVTAIELAVQDLNRLTREIPGADLVTAGHWKQAVKVAGYVQRANDLYSLLLPVFQPLTGLARLGTQTLVSRPAWREMQGNLIHWFFRAYVNRLGMHLIELYSGRLVIGPDQYRAWRKTIEGSHQGDAAGRDPIRVVVVGEPESGKATLCSEFERVLDQPRGPLGELDPDVREGLRRAQVVELGNTGDSRGWLRLGRQRQGVGQVDLDGLRDADLIILTQRATSESQALQVRLGESLAGLGNEPDREKPPILLVLTCADELNGDLPWSPPYAWSSGTRRREVEGRAPCRPRSVRFPRWTQWCLSGARGEWRNLTDLERVWPAWSRRSRLGRFGRPF